VALSLLTASRSERAQWNVRLSGEMQLRSSNLAVMALHYAAKCGKLETVEYLLSVGDDNSLNLRLAHHYTTTVACLVKVNVELGCHAFAPASAFIFYLIL